MQTRTVNGHQATDRDGAAELLDRSRRWIDLSASPKKRPETGFPEPCGKEDGRDWYPVADLTAYRAKLDTPKEKNTPARAPRSGDPNELIPAVVFREWLGIEQGTWKRYVKDSEAEWDAGHDGYLPLYDDKQPGKRGWIYYWKRHRANEWIDSRPGKEGATGRPVGATKAAATATLADAEAAVRAAADRGEAMSGTKLAEALGVPLNRAYVLLRQIRAADTDVSAS
ncbi:hypothetical protein [Longispora fulva]|uniref:Uncharacterized protein n=2 Tax=Longispora fulva TaxID=619741 RepID=A0A8J7KT96_9ACTN|nr:hypothetical protein [Longispora fulva]MBG6140487.1 hypothetical protein [Longispora fulva]